MGDTTLTLDESTKQKLDLYRHDSHDSWTDVLEGMMAIIPAVKSVQLGCSHCQQSVRSDLPTEEKGGFIQFFTHTTNGETKYFSNYYCSKECVTSVIENVEQQFPENPDEVRVGGREMPVSRFEGARFYLDGEAREVLIDIPGAFQGASSHGIEYEYDGEPVYLKNEGEWIQSGVIDDILHEESHTALILGSDAEIEEDYHPESE